MFSEDLERHLERLNAGSESVAEFRHWFSKAWWEAESGAPEDLYALASDIEHYGYILDSGVWDTDQFKTELRERTSGHRVHLTVRPIS